MGNTSSDFCYKMETFQINFIAFKVISLGCNAHMITFFFQLSNLSKSPLLKAFKALSDLALVSGIETKRYPRCCLFTFLSTIRVDYNHESYIQTYGITTAHLTKTVSSIDVLRISCCILSGRSLKSVDFQKFLNYF